MKYETYYDKFQSHFGEKIKQLHYMDCVSFELSIKTKNNIMELQIFEDLFDCSNLIKNHKVFSDKNKKLDSKLKHHKNLD